MIGEFRDFDEGMRRMDTKKLEEVKSILRWRLDESLLRQFYYSLEDFYRIAAPVQEIIQLIRLGNKVLRKLTKEPDKVCVEAKNIGPDHGPPKVTLMAVAYLARKRLFRDCLETIKDYEVTMNRVDLERETVLVCRLTRDGKPVSSARLKALISKVEELGSTSNPPAAPRGEQ